MFPDDARRKQFAGIGLIFQRDTCGDGLQTLEARGRVKVDTLLAAMKGGATFGAGAFEI